MASPSDAIITPSRRQVMRAVVMRRTGGPEVLGIEERPVPQARPGEVLIRVKASGVNRLDVYARQGLREVTLPRILGIEAVGVVARCPGGEFHEGDTVATALGGMGLSRDGGYAEYTCVSAAQVQALRTSLAWETLGALPEMLQTAWGSLFRSLRLEAGERLLIRGGTTAIGSAAAAIAKLHGAIVAATTRRPEHQARLRSSGVEQVFVDNGIIANEVHEVFPGGVDKVLELVDGGTLEDSLHCAKSRGVVCVTGKVGRQITSDHFNPAEAIPSAVYLTTYHGSADDFMRTPLQNLIDNVASGALHVEVGRVFQLEQIADAHASMEEGTAGGKIVVLP
jgi:NADPH:quinone reductase-like Zn-dependent oxidoreductase